MVASVGFINHKNIVNQLSNLVSIVILSITTTSCGIYKQQNQDEIIVVPRIPEKFSKIPVPRHQSEFIPLPDKKKVRTNFTVGRSNPFLPPSYDTKNMSLPSSLKLIGILRANEKPLALIRNLNSSDLIEEGFVGGVDTKLLPTGWRVVKIDTTDESLTLKYLKKTLRMQLWD